MHGLTWRWNRRRRWHYSCCTRSYKNNKGGEIGAYTCSSCLQEMKPGTKNITAHACFLEYRRLPLLRVSSNCSSCLQKIKPKAERHSSRVPPWLLVNDRWNRDAETDEIFQLCAGKWLVSPSPASLAFSFSFFCCFLLCSFLSVFLLFFCPLFSIFLLSFFYFSALFLPPFMLFLCAFSPLTLGQQPRLLYSLYRALLRKQILH